MNRRQVMMLSGAAVVAGSGFSQTGQPAALSRSGAKTLLKLSRPKSSYKIPKSDAKRAKFLDSLNAALALTPDQQQQAATLFTNALAARTALRSSLKTARQKLSEAVKSDNNSVIDQVSASIGNLKAQLISTGAGAHAAFNRILTSDQQAKLTQFQS
jgi:Spy/CpxP family protein refolding chaperone